MGEIQRSQTYPVPSGRCFEGLLRVWKAMEIQTKASDPNACTAEGHWNHSGMKMTFRAECKDIGEGNTLVTMRHDTQWDPFWSRPSLMTTKAEKTFNDKVLVQMDRVLDTLAKYLEDETSLPKLSPPAGLDLDHLAWILGTILSIVLRLAADRVGMGWFPALPQGMDREATYFKIIGVLGVAIGAVAAGLIKRRNPLKGNAFFEGMIVALPNIWLSMVLYKSFFQMGCVDWGVYGLTGLTFAAIASLKFGKTVTNLDKK